MKGGQCCCQILIILTAISLWQACDTAHDLSILQVETIRQMRDEWTQKPFIEINVRNGKCMSSEEPLFAVTWGGTERGCYNWGASHPAWVETIDDFQQNKRTKYSSLTQGQDNAYFRDDECNMVWAKDAISQDNFLGKRLCGRRGGLAYEHIKRANEKNECPSGMHLCSNHTSFEDSICTNSTADCPINEIKFVKSSGRLLQTRPSEEPKPEPQEETTHEEPKQESAPELENASESQTETDFTPVKTELKDGQKSQEMGQGWSLITSTHGKGRPIMKFFAGDHACIQHDTYQRPSIDTERFYPLERDREEHRCPVQHNTKWQYDSRYKDAGFRISELRLQTDNKVTEALHGMPLYSKYVPNETQIKSGIEYQFQVRELIPWKLQCEKDATRRKIVSQIDQVDHHSNPVIQRIFWMSTIFIIVPLITTCGACCCMQSDKFVIPLIMVFMVQIMILFFAATRLQSEAFKMDQGSDLVEESLLIYAKVNGCSDEYTSIDVEETKQDLLNSQMVVEQQVLPVLDHLVGIIGSNFVFLFFVALLAFYRKKKEEERTGRHHEQVDEN